jgi:hypothetical protein
MKLENFSTDFRNILQYQISWKSVHWESSCSLRADRQTDTHTHTHTSTPDQDGERRSEEAAWIWLRGFHYVIFLPKFETTSQWKESCLSRFAYLILFQRPLQPSLPYEFSQYCFLLNTYNLGYHWHQLKQYKSPHTRTRLYWSQNRHNTTVWTDSRQGSKYQTHYCSCQRLHWNRSDWNVISPDCLAPTKCACFEPTVLPDTCCSVHRIRVLLQWTKRMS